MVGLRCKEGKGERKRREERDDKIKGLKVDARDQGEEPSREPFSHTKGRVFLHSNFIWAEISAPHLVCFASLPVGCEHFLGAESQNL